MHRAVRTKFLLLAGVVCAATLLYLWLLIENNTICISRTGIEPPQLFFTESAAFLEFGNTMRGEVLAALIRQYDTETGFFEYSIHPDGTLSSSNNAIRQLLGSRILAAESSRSGSIAELHQKNLEAIFAQWYREDGTIGYVYFDEKSKLGANAMLLRTLSASPHFEAYRSEAQNLANGIYALQNGDGSFRPWYIEPGYAYDADYLLTFYSGEAVLALLEYAERSGDVQAFEAAVRAQDFYIDHYVEQIEENYYPAYVPWHTQSLAHLFEATGERRYGEAIFVLNDKLLELQDTETYIGRFNRSDMPEYGSPHAASDAVYTEGLVYAHTAAQMAGDKKRADRYKNAVILGVHNLSRLQYEPDVISLTGEREIEERIRGGVQTHACNRWVRVDTNAHTVDALTALSILWPSDTVELDSATFVR